MATLYELTGEYLMLLDMMDDPTVDEQTLNDTMEAISGELEIKADGYAKIIKDREALADGLKAEAKRLSERRQTIENNVKRMKDALQRSMIATGKTKFKTDLFSFGIQKNPISIAVDAAIPEIPERFLTHPEPTVNKTALKEALQNGEDLDGIAHIVQGESLRIR